MYKTFDEIITQLRKYSFSDKIAFLFNNALEISSVAGIDLHRDNEIFPWELEFLVELSLFAIEDSNCEPINTQEMAKIATFIRNYRHSHFQEISDTFISDVMMVLAATQFKVQENIYNRLFRFWFYFSFKNNELDMEKEFKNTYGCDYYEFMTFAMLIRFYISRELAGKTYATARDIWVFILSHYEHIVKQLSITREQYVNDQSEKNNGCIENGYYGFNYIHSYPFVIEKEALYMPLPYLIVDAVTDSLFTRLTYGNDNLRERIGKQTAESYLTYILTDGKVYDEVYKEVEYYIGKKRIESPDVMIRKGSKICVFDSKLSTPGINIRQFDSKEIDKIVSRHADFVVQTYNRIKEFKYYNPFSKEIDYTEDDIFGIISVHEDSYVLKERVYNRAIDKLGLKKEDADYLVSHVFVLPLSQIEKYALYSRDIFPAIIDRRDDSNTWMDFNIVDCGSVSESNRIPAYENFMLYEEDLMMQVARDLVQNGLIRDNEIDNLK